MEVTRANFRDLLPEITDVINKASFICLDGEFTGLNAGDGVTQFDTPSQYYQKLKDGAMEFLFFQFGLCAFEYNETEEKYTHTAYNFYIFPRPHNRNAKDIRFMCQSSSLDFLASTGFDFNKVFREGIPYLCDSDEKDLRDRLDIKRKTLNEPVEKIRIPDDLKSCVESACHQIQEFLNSDKDEQELSLERPSAFARRLVYQEVKERFSCDELAVETKNYVMIARKIDGSEDRLKEEEKKREKEDADIDDAVGFTHVIRLLSKSGKMIVGHNLLLDLLHIVRQFYAPLPDTYEEFKELLHNIFPKILDTKHMCSSSPFKDILTTTALVNIVTAMKDPPFSLPDVDCEENKGYKSIDLKYHEAGFDAYMTGLVFLSLGNFLKKSKKSSDKENKPIAESPLLKPYINRLHLMRVLDTHINLGGPDPQPSRDHVFLLTFPKEWRYSEINHLFSPYGNIYIGWINDTSAWISLQLKEQVVNVKKTLLNKIDREGVTITHYDDLLAADNNSVFERPSPVYGGLNKMFNSPATSAARKRRSNDGQLNVKHSDSASNKRFKRDSFVKQRSSMSGVIADTIPEEQEVSPSVKSPKQVCKKASSDAIKTLASPRKNLEFDENDAWD